MYHWKISTIFSEANLYSSLVFNYCIYIYNIVLNERKFTLLFCSQTLKDLSKKLFRIQFLRKRWKHLLCTLLKMLVFKTCRNNLHQLTSQTIFPAKKANKIMKMFNEILFLNSQKWINLINNHRFLKPLVIIHDFLLVLSVFFFFLINFVGCEKFA